MAAHADTKKHNNKRRGAKIVALTAALVVAGGAAFAWWTAGGAGTGSASTGNVTGITINQTGTITGLYPGGSPVALAGTFTNTNAGPVRVAQVSVAVQAGWSVQADLAKPACTASDIVPRPAHGHQRRGACRHQRLGLVRSLDPARQRRRQPGQLQERLGPARLHEQLISRRGRPGLPGRLATRTERDNACDANEPRGCSSDCSRCQWRFSERCPRSGGSCPARSRTVSTTRPRCRTPRSSTEASRCASPARPRASSARARPRRWR